MDPMHCIAAGFISSGSNRLEKAMQSTRMDVLVLQDRRGWEEGRWYHVDCCREGLIPSSKKVHLSVVQLRPTTTIRSSANLASNITSPRHMICIPHERHGRRRRRMPGSTAERRRKKDAARTPPRLTQRQATTAASSTCQTDPRNTNKRGAEGVCGV